MEFVINQKLPSLNEYVNACRTHWAKGAAMKKDLEAAIGWYIRLAVKNGTLTPVSSPVIVCFTWVEKTRRRDKDNISSAKKFILDALVENGILADDGNNQITGFTDTFVYGKEYAVKVELKEVNI